MKWATSARETRASEVKWATSARETRASEVKWATMASDRELATRELASKSPKMAMEISSARDMEISIMTTLNLMMDLAITSSVAWVAKVTTRALTPRRERTTRALTSAREWATRAPLAAADRATRALTSTRELASKWLKMATHWPTTHVTTTQLRARALGIIATTWIAKAWKASTAWVATAWKDSTTLVAVAALVPLKSVRPRGPRASHRRSPLPRRLGLILSQTPLHLRAKIMPRRAGAERARSSALARMAM